LISSFVLKCKNPLRKDFSHRELKAVKQGKWKTLFLD